MRRTPSLAARDIAVRILHLGLPDRFIDHGEQSQLLAQAGLDRDGILKSIELRVNSAPAVSVRVA